MDNEYEIKKASEDYIKGAERLYGYKFDLEDVQVAYETGASDFSEVACNFFAPYIQDNSGGSERAYVLEKFRKLVHGNTNN